MEFESTISEDANTILTEATSTTTQATSTQPTSTQPTSTQPTNTQSNTTTEQHIMAHIQPTFDVDRPESIIETIPSHYLNDPFVSNSIKNLVDIISKTKNELECKKKENEDLRNQITNMEKRIQSENEELQYLRKFSTQMNVYVIWISINIVVLFHSITKISNNLLIQLFKIRRMVKLRLLV